MIYDAVRVRLTEIGEAVAAVSEDVLASEPQVPWRDVKGMRNHLAHRYFDTAHAIVAATVVGDLPPLPAAVARLLEVWTQTRRSVLAGPIQPAHRFFGGRGNRFPHAE